MSSPVKRTTTPVPALCVTMEDDSPKPAHRRHKDADLDLLNIKEALQGDFDKESPRFVPPLTPTRVSSDPDKKEIEEVRQVYRQHRFHVVLSKMPEEKKE